MVRLNLGCGFAKRPGFVNADVSSGCQPDVQIDLARETWPWSDSSAEEVYFSYSLEEMGETKSDLFHVIKELFRVCAPDAKVSVTSIHPRHDQFILNPLCVHPITPDFLRLLSVQSNMQQIAEGFHDTCLAFVLGVNFEIKRVKFLLSKAFQQQLETGGAAAEEALRQRMLFEVNICQAVEIDLKAIKVSELV